MAMSKNQARSVGNFTEKIRRFLRGVWSELKKVHWPSRRELITYTIIVMIVSLFVAALIWIVDSLLSLLFSFIQ